MDEIVRGLNGARRNQWDFRVDHDGSVAKRVRLELVWISLSHQIRGSCLFLLSR